MPLLLWYAAITRTTPCCTRIRVRGMRVARGGYAVDLITSIRA